METENPTARNVEARRGFFPIVTGDNVSVTQAGATFCMSRGDLSLTQAGAQLSVAGGNLTIREGGCLALLAGGNATITEGGSVLLATAGDVSISEGGAVAVAARQVRVEHSFVGLLVSPKAEIADDSTLLLGPRQAAILGAAAGAVCALLSRGFAALRRR